MTVQLALVEGYEIEHPVPNTAALTDAQRFILRHVGEHGSIRSTEAGLIVHQCSRPAQLAAERGNLESHLACRRRYRAADGLAACHRLAERGLLVRAAPGVWLARPEATLA